MKDAFWVKGIIWCIAHVLHSIYSSSNGRRLVSPWAPAISSKLTNVRSHMQPTSCLSRFKVEPFSERNGKQIEVAQNLRLSCSKVCVCKNGFRTLHGLNHGRIDSQLMFDKFCSYFSFSPFALCRLPSAVYRLSFDMISINNQKFMALSAHLPTIYPLEVDFHKNIKLRRPHPRTDFMHFSFNEAVDSWSFPSRLTIIKFGILPSTLRNNKIAIRPDFLDAYCFRLKLNKINYRRPSTCHVLSATPWWDWNFLWKISAATVHARTRTTHANHQHKTVGDGIRKKKNDGANYLFFVIFFSLLPAFSSMCPPPLVDCGGWRWRPYTENR